LALPACRRGGTPMRVDVVLITIDTLRTDRVDAYGNTRGVTPVIDGLAANGTRFADAVAVAPLTLPSHASILTATTPLVHGIHDNIAFVLPAGIPTVAERFAAAGYDTAAFVSGFPLDHRFGLARGFGEYDDRFTTGGDRRREAPTERLAADTVAAALAWIERPRADGRPLFVWVHLFDPHAPYEAPEPYRSRFVAQPYDGEVAYADAQIGVLLNRLTRARPDRQPLVVVTADHGEGLGDHREPTHGLFVYDSTLRVPLVVSGPAVAHARVVTAGVRSIDIAPTLLDLAGVPPLDGAEGVSLRNAVIPTAAFTPQPAYAESLFGELCCGWAPLHAWRDGHLMFIDAPTPELYDFAADPDETHNLAADRPDEAARMRRALEAALARARPSSHGAITTDARERLRSLGYADGGGSRSSRRDPKDMIDVSTRIGEAVDIEDRDPARAAALLEEVLRTDPPNATARRHLGIALMGLRRYEEASRVLRVLIENGDRSTETAVLRADAAIGHGDLAEARGLLEQVHAVNPAESEVTFKLGLVLARMNKPAEAIPLFTAVVEQEPANVDARVDLGTVLVDAGRAADALPQLERAIAMGANTPLVFNGLGFAKLGTGDRSGAADAFERSLRLDANQPDIAAAVRRARPQ
jgi:arylsulfatase A-like enzyme/Flp pilus assembly protein TadD